MRKEVWGILLVGASSIAPPAFAGATPGYLYEVRTATVFELPRLGGDESEARDINNAGQIVGSSLNDDGVWNAFLYQPYGLIQNIGTAVMSEESAALGINNNAEVVGSWFRGGVYRPFYWHSSVGFMKLDIGVQPGEDYNDQYFIRPYAINDYGQIVGHAHGDYGIYEAEIPVDGCHWDVPVYWSSRIAAPKVLKCSSDWWGPDGAWDISNSGWIVHSGAGTREHGYRHALSSATSYDVPQPVPGSGDVSIRGVNEAGAVVGWASSTEHFGPRQAIFWNGISAKSRILGVLAGGAKSTAFEVNDQNFVVGHSEKGLHVNGAPFVGTRAYLWHADFGMHELPAFPNGESGWVSVCRAYALDNLAPAGRAGMRIRAVGTCTSNGKIRAVRWDVYIDEHRAPGTL